MKILCLFAGQGYRGKNPFSLFHDNQEAEQYIQECSALAAMDFLQPNLPSTEPQYIQLIIGMYQSTLFTMLHPLFAGHSLDCAGYSLGQISAFLASTQASVSVIQKVLSFRTSLMTSQCENNDYDLLLIKSILELEELSTLCTQYDCSIAIVNLGQHVILGGSVANLKKLQLILPQYQVNESKFLGVYRPSHTPFYLNKKGLLQQFLASTNLTRLHYPLYSPITCAKIYDCNDMLALLDEELYTTLRWDKIGELIKENLYDLIIDLGPGPAMTNLINFTNASVKIITAEDYNHIDGVISAIKRTCGIA
jgi:malonyl CoA-acyl carrier protein transacylase